MQTLLLRTLEVEVDDCELCSDVRAGREADQREVVVVRQSILRQSQLQGALCVEEVSQPVVRHL